MSSRLSFGNAQSLPVVCRGSGFLSLCSDCALSASSAFLEPITCRLVTVSPLMNTALRRLGMDRRVLVKSLFGVASASALAIVLPPQAEALMGLSKDPAPDSGVLPDLEKLNEPVEDGEAPKEGVQLAQYYYRRHRRRRYRRWRWRNYCRRSYWHGYYRRRCYRRRVAFWIWI